MELTERYQDWRNKSPSRSASGKKEPEKETLDGKGTMMSSWEFETMRRTIDETVIVGSIVRLATRCAESRG